MIVMTFKHVMVIIIVTGCTIFSWQGQSVESQIERVTS